MSNWQSAKIIQKRSEDEAVMYKPNLHGLSAQITQRESKADVNFRLHKMHFEHVKK